MSRYYIKPDDQYDYKEGHELYHLFDRKTLNRWGKHACLLPFGRYEECESLRETLETEDSPCLSQPESETETSAC